MKKLITFIFALIMTFALTACQQENNTTNESNDITPITLTIGDTILDAYLNDSSTAQSLIAQLPLTLTLNDSDNDFCGGHIDLEYSENDLTSGYKNGDLVFWPTANNFVIFVNGEENSESTDHLIKLGRITSSQELLDTLDGEITVTIALKDENSNSATNEKQGNTEEETTLKIKISVGDSELFATFENNATARALIEQMPFTIPMEDLYDREMCYRYGADAFPTENLRTDSYEIGDIAYWPPRGSLVILYAQNKEQFERQHLGHIDFGVEIFENTGNTEVTFENITE